MGDLVGLDWVPYAPGNRVLGWVGRDARSRSNAPGNGPARWTEVEPTEWLWKKGSRVAVGVMATVCGTNKQLRFKDLRYLSPLPADWDNRRRTGR